MNSSVPISCQDCFLKESEAGYHCNQHHAVLDESLRKHPASNYCLTSVEFCSASFFLPEEASSQRHGSSGSPGMWCQSLCHPSPGSDVHMCNPEAQVTCTAAWPKQATAATFQGAGTSTLSPSSIPTGRSVQIII